MHNNTCDGKNLAGEGKRRISLYGAWRPIVATAAVSLAVLIWPDGRMGNQSVQYAVFGFSKDAAANRVRAVTLHKSPCLDPDHFPVTVHLTAAEKRLRVEAAQLGHLLETARQNRIKINDERPVGSLRNTFCNLINWSLEG